MPDPGENTVTALSPFERIVETVAREGRSEKDWNWLLPTVRALRRDKYRELLTEAGVPAMVKALAEATDALDTLLDAAQADNENNVARREELFSDAAWKAATAFPRARAVLGGEVQAGADRSELEAESERLRDALGEANEAMRRMTVVGIALADQLDEPYPDAPEWTPYTRFMKPALRRIEKAREAARAALNGPPASTSNDRGDE